MSMTLTRSAGIPHFKTRGFAGQHTLERCEDTGCTVTPGGSADCGRLACPSCGFSGSNLTAPDGFDGDHLARCACGHAWNPRTQAVRAA
jgi:hypothetical protein